MRGATIAIFMLCLSVFGGFMAVGVNDELGIGMRTGLQDEADQVDSQLGGQQNLADRGGTTGLLGFAVFAIKQLAVFSVMIGSIASLIAAWGQHHPAIVALGAGIEMIARVIQALMIIWIARGLSGE